MSEEGEDDLSRLDASRVWIIDPLDGSSSYGRGIPEWAVHVALVIDGVGEVGAVASPGVGVVASSYRPAEVTDPGKRPPIVVTGRTRAHNDGQLVAEALGAESGAQIVAMSSAGVKASLLAVGRADVYVHDSPLYEWDVCAPAVMAAAAGLDVSTPMGEAFVFNKARPVVEGLVISRPEFTERVLACLRDRRSH